MAGHALVSRHAASLLHDWPLHVVTGLIHTAVVGGLLQGESVLPLFPLWGRKQPLKLLRTVAYLRRPRR